MKKGKIIPNGVILEKHEYRTVLLFTEMGVDIELIPKSEKKRSSRTRYCDERAKMGNEKSER